MLICISNKLMIPSGSTNYNDNSGNNDRNDSNNDSIPRPAASGRSQLFSPSTSGHASRRSNARAFFYMLHIWSF